RRLPVTGLLADVGREHERRARLDRAGAGGVRHLAPVARVRRRLPVRRHHDTAAARPGHRHPRAVAVHDHAALRRHHRRAGPDLARRGAHTAQCAGMHRQTLPSGSMIDWLRETTARHRPLPSSRDLQRSNHMRKRVFIRAAAATLAAAGLALGAANAQDATRVGFIYVGPIGDHGWTYRHDVARRAIAAESGDAVDSTDVESVAAGADAERVIRNLAQRGNDLIFTTSFGFMNPTAKVAAQFPDVKFEHATGYKQADNLATYSARFYEGRAVIGTIAGHMTKSGIIGYIASFPIPEVVRGINAFTIAMRKVNPDAEVKVVWVNSWYD